ncbi:MAG: chitobiase/beta-hexosaminidase C-terminal domain-containing protein [Alistipes sp.]|nr:chitobiase/beta-hexosaminidase C-terminal domain-containing protein [Alistipes sp.]
MPRRVNFRVSSPGLRRQDGILRANSAEPGATIRHTPDGSEPTEASDRSICL